MSETIQSYYTIPIRSTLRSIQRMMQMSGSADGMRNLVDSDLPKLLKQIFVDAPRFGPRVFSLGESLRRNGADDSYEHHGLFRAQRAYVSDCSTGTRSAASSIHAIGKGKCIHARRKPVMCNYLLTLDRQRHPSCYRCNLSQPDRYRSHPCSSNGYRKTRQLVCGERQRPSPGSKSR